MGAPHRPVSVPPPVAEKRPKVLSHHGDSRVDEYYWMRERESPEVRAYLEAENEYTKAATAHTEEFCRQLYREILGRIKETDLSAPARKGPYEYYVRTEEGKPYSIHCRRLADSEDEEVLLDENQLAEGHDYFALGTLAVSPDHRRVAFSVDTRGDERFDLRVKEIVDGALHPEVIPGTSYSVAWAEDSSTLFYTVQDQASRPYQLRRHGVGEDPENDPLVHQEDDDRFHVSIARTRSGRFLLLEIASQITSEVHFVPTADPSADFSLIAARRDGVEYSVAHHEDRFLITVNDRGVNFRLVEAAIASPGAEHWQEVIAHRADVMLEGVTAFEHTLVIHERRDGLPHMRIREVKTGTDHTLQHPEESWFAGPGENLEYEQTHLRFTYTSMVTPRSVFDYDFSTRCRTLKKRQPVVGGYDREQYETHRLYATAADGTRVPISLVRRRDTAAGPAPLLLTGYGSYGVNTEAYFSSARLSLLDRGVSVALAHVRGGGEMGRLWYENGKFLHKRNTFTDFIACAEHLVAEGHTSPERLAISGGSAGGLLMGAVMNLRPELFCAVIADVPFVDVVTTMLDASLPLTVIEYDEWGNPEEREYYEYMKSYSPYDNVRAADYPHLLITAGLNDPRVQYWEPAKWAARLRAHRTDHNLQILKTNMEAGHAGRTGRYGQIEEIAFEYAFILDRLGATTTVVA